MENRIFFALCNIQEFTVLSRHSNAKLSSQVIQAKLQKCYEIIIMSTL